MRGCRGRAVSVRGGSAGLETAGSPPGRARHGRRRVTARRGRSAGGDPTRGGLRVWQSAGLPLLPCRCRCCPAGCVAVAVRSIAVTPLWGAYAVTVAFLWRRIGIYTLSHKKRSDGVLEALRAIGIYARMSGGRRRTRQDAPGRAQAAQGTQKPRRAYIRTGQKESRPRGAAEGLRVAGDPDQDQHGQQQGVQ